MRDDFPDILDPRSISLMRAAARRAGMSTDQWLAQAVEHQISAENARYFQGDAETPQGGVSADDGYLTPVSQLVDQGSFAEAPCASLKDEVERLQEVIQACNHVLGPATALADAIPKQIAELKAVVAEARRATDAAQKAAATVLPLERALLRLIEESQTGVMDDRHDKRASSIGRLLRGHA